MLFVRSVPGSRFVDEARELAPDEGRVTEVSFTPPETFARLPGFDHAFVPFGSDAPRLRHIVGGGRVVLCGPGSIKVAHTVDEHITGTDLVRGRDLLIAIATAVLGGTRS
jgi:hypothetical protein